MHCSLKLKKKVIFYSALQFASLFLFILSFTLSSVTLSPFTEAQFSPFTEAQVSSSLWSPLTWLSSTSPPPIVNVTTIHRPPPKPPLSSNPIVATRSLPPIVNVNICFNASQAAAQLRPDRRLPIVATDRQRQHLFQHGPKPLISSDPPPINSFSLRPTAIRLRSTPPIGVLAHRRCVCLWFLIFDIVCDQWFWLVWVEKKIGNLGFFFLSAVDWWWWWWWWWWVKIVAVAVVGVVNFFWKWNILFYCNSYIILLWYLYYFIMLKVKIDSLMQHMYR